MITALVSLTALCAAAAPTAPAPASLRVVVQPLVAQDPADARLARVVTDAVTAELRKLQHTGVIGTDEVKAALDLEAQRQLAGCTTQSCIAEIVEALGADALVIGNIARVGDDRVFGLKLINQRTMSTTSQFTQRLKAGNGEECLAIVGKAVATLFPDTPLRPGARRGVDPSLGLRLNPPPFSTWVFWTSAAATTAALGVGVAATVANAAAANDAGARLAAASAASPADGGALKTDVADVRTSFDVLVAGYAASVALGAATGVVALFTDWDGYRE